MKKGLVLLVWGAFVLAAGMFSAPPAAAQTPPWELMNSQFIFPETPGTRSRPVDEFISPAVKGIQKTVNIPSAAFNIISVPVTGGSWVNNLVVGAVIGATSTYAYLQAPVIFPKGAKKIVRIDYIMGVVTTGGQIGLAACPWSTSNAIAVYGATPAATGAWHWYYYVWPTASQPEILPGNQYFLALYINNQQALKGVIITYK